MQSLTSFGFDDPIHKKQLLSTFGSFDPSLKCPMYQATLKHCDTMKQSVDDKYIYILKRVYLGSKLFFMLQIIKTVKTQQSTQNYTDDYQKYGWKCLGRRYGTIPLPPRAQH